MHDGVIKDASIFNTRVQLFLKVVAVDMLREVGIYFRAAQEKVNEIVALDLQLDCVHFAVVLLEGLHANKLIVTRCILYLRPVAW